MIKEFIIELRSGKTYQTVIPGNNIDSGAI
jgi:hypothetical protein